MNRTFICLMLVGLASGLHGCAAYRIGNQALFRPEVRSIHVPVFESDSFRAFLGERLTEAVVKEIEARTPYKVTSLDSADSILQGKIVADRKRVLIESRTDEARDIQVSLMVQVGWTDRYGRPLMKSQQLKVQEMTNFVPEGGQSMATAQQVVIDRIARDIVSQMEVNW